MAEPQAARPVPAANQYVETEAFWQGARDRRLLLQVCTDTGRFQHYPRPVSVQTGSRRLAWREVSGRGRIYACTTLRVGPPDVAPRTPLPIVLVELEEGVRIIGNIVRSEGRPMRIGAAVELAWDMLEGGQPYPAFRLAD